MDPIKNPYSPGAGSPPPELVGRDGVLRDARVLLGRVRRSRPEKSLLLTGLRGVGKTVLLNEVERLAIEDGYHIVSVEASENKPLGPLLAPHLRKLLFEFDRVKGAGDKAKRGLAVLKSFLNGIKLTLGDYSIGLDIDPEQGAADSGDIEIDLPALFAAVAEAAQERGAAIALLIDEIHYFSERELAAVIMAMHKIQQRRLPMVVVGAGLPILPSLAGDSKSYAERLFGFPIIGPLLETDARLALSEPATNEGVVFEVAGLDEIYRLTQGYPYFLQEWGYQSWNAAEGDTISLDAVHRATKVVVPRLDESFFRVRFDRLTPTERLFLRAMAELGPGPHRTGDVAERLRVKVSSLGPRRSSLIAKGMIYSPAHGEMAFTVPLFDEFLQRAMPEFPV